MGAFSMSPPEGGIEWRLPLRGRVGMSCLIVAESAIFTIFVVAYLFFIGKSPAGPQPRDVLHRPIFFTVCLLSSSLTVHFAVGELAKGDEGFCVLVALHHSPRWRLSSSGLRGSGGG